MNDVNHMTKPYTSAAAPFLVEGPLCMLLRLGDVDDCIAAPSGMNPPKFKSLQLQQAAFLANILF